MTIYLYDRKLKRILRRTNSVSYALALLWQLVEFEGRYMAITFDNEDKFCEKT